MSFQDPRWLWLLAFAVPLLLFWRRRAPVRERVVASLYLLRRAVQRATSQSPSRRRFPPWSLWVWSALLAALACALAKPVRTIEGQARVLLLLENGARMQARSSDGGTRWTRLQERADAFLAALPSCRVTLDVFPEGIREEADASSIRRRLAAIEPSSLPARASEEIAARASSLSSFDLAVLGSDREPVRVADLGKVDLLPMLVGEPSRNVGWVSLAKTDSGYAAVVKNFSAERQMRRMQRKESGRVVSEEVLDLDPGEAREIVLQGPFEIRLEPEDEFALDDSLFPGKLPHALRVRVPSDLHPSFARAFAAIPGVTVIEAFGAIQSEDEADIFLRARPVQSVRNALHFRLDGAPFVPQSFRREDKDLLGKHLGFEGVRIAKAHASAPRNAWALAWAVGEDGVERPLLWREGGDLAMGFDLADSDWDRHPSFPVFLAAWIAEIRSAVGGPNFLHPDQSDTNGVWRDLGSVTLPPGAGQREESLSGFFLVLAMFLFFAAAFLEWRGK